MKEFTVPIRSQTQVLIVDDHDAVRQALRMLLNPEKDIRVVGDAFQIRQRA